MLESEKDGRERRCFQVSGVRKSYAGYGSKKAAIIPASSWKHSRLIT
jgi:hypothetical protein